MHLISIVRSDYSQVPVYVARDLDAAQHASKTVALSCLNTHAEQTDSTVVVDKIFDSFPNFEEYKDSIVGFYTDQTKLYIEILKIERVNKGLFFFNNFVLQGKRLELIKIVEIAEFMILDPVKVQIPIQVFESDQVSEFGLVSESDPVRPTTSDVTMKSMYPGLKKDSKEHVEFMDELKAVMKK